MLFHHSNSDPSRAYKTSHRCYFLIHNLRERQMVVYLSVCRLANNLVVFTVSLYSTDNVPFFCLYQGSPLLLPTSFK